MSSRTLTLGSFRAHGSSTPSHHGDDPADAQLHINGKQRFDHSTRRAEKGDESMGRIREASVRVGRVAGLSVLAAEGAFFAIMGFHDAILATRREERLLGGALVAAGAALLGAVMLFTHRTQKWADRAVQAL